MKKESKIKKMLAISIVLILAALVIAPIASSYTFTSTLVGNVENLERMPGPNWPANIRFTIATYNPGFQPIKITRTYGGVSRAQYNRLKNAKENNKLVMVRATFDSTTTPKWTLNSVQYYEPVQPDPNNPSQSSPYLQVWSG